MKKHLFHAIFALLPAVLFSQTICNPNGNVVIYSNYDGGHLLINVDVNIPNLKIGITTYEAIQVEITGPYAANVTQVVYAGYAGNNDHCNTGHNVVAIMGVPSSAASILVHPPATYSDPNGNPNIICAYNCGGTTGGCNTAEQISHFFLTQFGGSLYSHYTQYGCYYYNTPFYVSNGGNCCLIPGGLPPIAAFTASSTVICAGDCISFFDQSANNPTAWSWNLQGSTVPFSTAQNPSNICYMNPGTYPVSLTVSNGNGSNTLTQQNYIQVNANPPVPVITEVFNTLYSSASSGNQWYLNSLPIQGATGQSWVFTQNGTYHVEVTNTAGCSSMSAPHLVTTTALDHLNLQDLSVYPNPFSDRIHIRIPSGTTRQVRLMNAAGILFFDGIISQAEFALPTERLQAGLYILAVEERFFRLVKN
ncbi:MAG TPA: PKD domain-containing protein [Bacteroidales bacterium]|nr:PKD domain-containing protein [Bacteroidales bacterium]HSA44822.1 PKD domain-containing protein [Bacteroidales bacterium]